MCLLKHWEIGNQRHQPSSRVRSASTSRLTVPKLSRTSSWQRIFNQPPPTGLKEREAEIRGVVSAAPGFRSWTAVGPTSTGGIIVLVADDKAAADEIMRRMREYDQANHPELAATMASAQPQLIEGQAIRRILAE